MIINNIFETFKSWITGRKNPPGWAISWEKPKSDTAIGCWVGLPVSGQRHVALRVLVNKPLREPSEHGYYRDYFFALGEPVKTCDHVLIINKPKTKIRKEIKKAISDGYARMLVLIHSVDCYGERNTPLYEKENGDRIRFKPEGYEETVGMTAEQQEEHDRFQAFSKNPPPLWALMNVTFGELWHHEEYPTLVSCGYLAWEHINRYRDSGGIKEVDKFCGTPMVLDRSLKPGQVSFTDSKHPGDPKFNRIIEMPD